MKVILNKRTNFKIGEDCPSGNYCDFKAWIVTSDTEEGDDGAAENAIVTGIFDGNGNTFPLATPQPIYEITLLEQELNALGKGTFKVNSDGNGKVFIESLQNGYLFDTAGINYTLEGDNLFLPFHRCNCNEQLQGCDPSVEKCNYHLNRRFETSNSDNIFATSITFTGSPAPVAFPARTDTKDIATILTFLRTLPQGETARAFYQNDTFNIEFLQSQYGVEKFVFTKEFRDSTGLLQTETSETVFTKSGCQICCPNPCGGEGQPPCNNSQGDGCNNGLAVAPFDSLCHGGCKDGFTYFGGKLIRAGGIGELPDCKGNCNTGLIVKDGVCMPPDTTNTVCDFSFEFVRNPSEKFISINMCDLGIRQPPAAILLGDGAELQEWLNSEAANICPAGSPVENCITVTRIAEPDTTSYYRYSINIDGVAFNCNNALHKVITTTNFECDGECYSDCLVPDCETVTYTPACFAGETWSELYHRCIPNDAVCNDPSHQFGTYVCNNDVDTTTLPPELVDLLAHTIANFDTATYLANGAYAANHNIPRGSIDKIIAMNRLIVQYPQYEAYRLCVKGPDGVERNEF